MPPPPPGSEEDLVRRVGTDADLPAVFAEQARAVGMDVTLCDASELSRMVAECLRDAGVQQVSHCSAPRYTPAITEGIEAAGATVVDWTRGPGMDALYDCDAAVTDIAMAVAESGTMVYDSDRDHSRGGFLVPPVHIAVVPASCIVPDLVDWVRAYDSLPAASVLITGPSKTADIEGILVTGVHGPGQVHVLVLQDG